TVLLWITRRLKQVDCLSAERLKLTWFNERMAKVSKRLLYAVAAGNLGTDDTAHGFHPFITINAFCAQAQSFS
ncbi:hypothetical protein SMA60_28175, partial [Escherichia coli]|uniref:hypothetical protein n=1 Tax=Escherichia coli TaxID=562 RepID=UPI003079D4A6